MKKMVICNLLIVILSLNICLIDDNLVEGYYKFEPSFYKTYKI